MSNDKHTRKIAVIGNGLVSVEAERSELATLRAEKAELIEALSWIDYELKKSRLSETDLVDIDQCLHRMEMVILKTLAKLETK